MEPATAVEAQAAWQRRTLAVMVADVVGYSHLMEEDEAGTHARMRALRTEIIAPSILSHRGEVIKHTGDGFLACFESPLDAVRCATSLQEAITQREAQQQPQRRIVFRIGLNVESVIVDEHDVFGSGVNIASRLQGQAPAGGIVLSSAMRDAAGDDLGLHFDDLGELHLKNITRPVRAFALAAPGPRRTGWLPANENARAHLPTLAVLPLRNLTPDKINDYLAEGIVEDIITSLAALHDLFVIARGSVLGLGGEATVDTVSQRLGVRYVLDGSLRQNGESFQFTFRLNDAASGSVLWSERHECTRAAVFDLQHAVLDRLVSSIASHVRRAEIARAQRTPPGKLDAYDYLLQALGLLYRLDYPSFARARTLIEAAIAADPNYAAPYAYGAKWHIFNVGQGWSSHTEQDAAEALRLSDLARERDPSDGLAHAVHGHVQGMLHRDYAAALEAFDCAMAAAPGSSWVWLFSSATYGFVGRAEEGVMRAERALRLSPLDRHAFYFYNFLAQNHYLGGAYDQALIWSRKALYANPRFAAAARMAAASLVALGRPDEARRAVQLLMSAQPGFTVGHYARHCPFEDPQVVATYLERLREAGFPT